MLEVGSPTTALNDYTTKRDGYAAFGIPEYWRFDPTGGERYPTGLAGDRLVEGAYQPMSIVQVDSDNFWGHSDVLNLDLCWELGRLRWWDPVAQRYLTTYDEEADRAHRRAGGTLLRAGGSIGRTRSPACSRGPRARTGRGTTTPHLKHKAN